jgi:hypothetical protein
MTRKTSPLDWEAVDDAFGALQPFYDPGDDGDGVRLSLDAVASVLADSLERDLDGDEPLSSILDDLTAPQDLRKMIDDLYEAAKGGSYGDGMSKEQTKKVNDLVQDIYEPLHDFLKAVERRPPAPSSKSKPSKKSKPPRSPHQARRPKTPRKPLRSKKKSQAGRKR